MSLLNWVKRFTKVVLTNMRIENTFLRWKEMQICYVKNRWAIILSHRVGTISAWPFTLAGVYRFRESWHMCSLTSADICHKSVRRPRALKDDRVSMVQVGWLTHLGIKSNSRRNCVASCMFCGCWTGLLWQFDKNRNGRLTACALKTYIDN